MEAAAWVPGQIDSIVFDVIGTLVDEDRAWTSAAERLAVEVGLGEGVDLLSSWTGLLEERMGAVVDGDAAWAPHQQLVVDTAREAVVTAGGEPSAAALAGVASLDGEYPAWPDVAHATAALRRDRLVAGVSNGDLASLARLANRNAISWDIALSTSAVRTFKPAPEAYRYAIDALRLDPARTLFVAAHPWDLRAAAEHGFRTAYVARPGAERPSSDDRFDLAVDDVTGVVDLLAGTEGMTGSTGADRSPL
jgi:2-haloacid dehalogenase